MNIEEDKNWQDHRTEQTGEYYHPTFFSAYTDPNEYDAFIAAFQLETMGWYMGDGVPRAEEVLLRQMYDNNENENAMACWAPTADHQQLLLEDRQPKDGWFVLWLADTEDGPFVCWARVTTTERKEKQ